MSKILYSRTDIEKSIDEVRAEIVKYYFFNSNLSETNPLLIVVVLKGALHFFSKLTLGMKTPSVVGLVSAKTYDEKTGNIGKKPVVEIVDLPDRPIEYILILDDICDSGKTLREVKNILEEKYNPKSIKIGVLLYNPDGQKEIQPDFVCEYTNGKFVFGYGLDSKNGLDRNIPFIAYEEPIIDHEENET
jgi:hypoxanthine phosphoribosyltransferase